MDLVSVVVTQDFSLAFVVQVSLPQGTAVRDMPLRNFILEVLFP